MPTRTGWWIVAAAAAALATEPAAAQDPAPPPCPAGVMVTPTFGVADNPESESSDTRDYATHPLTIAAGFQLEAQAYTSEATWTLPAGLTRVSDDLAVQALPSSTPDQASMVATAATAGAYPVTLTWTQTDGTRDGRCTGTASTTIQAAAAAPPKLRRPRVTPGLPDESTVVLALAKHGRDLRPLEVHLRWVGAQRFPGTGAKERVLTVPQFPSGAGSLKATGAQIRAGTLAIVVKPVVGTLLDSLSFVFHARITGRIVSAPFGYDLDIRQAGQTVTRLRVAGRCKRFDGIVTCTTKRLSLI
ncbi:MAG: hypothetical protein QOE38_1509 [Thermoleophilaceae bacterium]|nr:hypothetical protein [Thermoleophilaceae bacterium]